MKKRIISLALVIILVLSLLPVSAFAGESLNRSETYINPLYRGIISASDIPSPQPKRLYASSNSADEYADGLDAAAAVLRDGMEKRKDKITVKVVTDSNDVLKPIGELALDETGVATQGDYIRWTYGGWNGNQSGYKKDGLYYLTLVYNVSYYTTAAQEAALGKRIDEVISGFGFDSNTTDYEKICAVYDYICSNVSYDHTHENDSTYMLKHTAYAAMMNGTAVCQGYATLMYRMLMQEGVGCRLIPSSTHAWNIVRIDGLYYNVDSTWDAGHKPGYYTSFLLSDKSFTDHPRDSRYTTKEFYAAYPMSTADYVQPGEHTVHLWGPGIVTKQPSCTENGITTYTCTLCGKVKTEAIAASRHKAEIKNALDPSCTEAGYTGDTVCTVCGETVEKGKTIAKLGHSYTKKVVKPTAAKQGYTQYTCSVCGYSYKTSYTIAAPTVKLSNVASTGKIKLSWSKIAGADKYYIYRSTDGGKTYKFYTSTTSTSYTNTSAAAGKTYYYKVKAVKIRDDKKTYSAYSTAHYLTCDLARPTVKITTSKGDPKLSWAKVTGATKYEVYRATSKSGKYTKMITTSKTSYTNTSAIAGKTYYYKVKAICGTTAASSAYSTVVSIKAK